MNCMIYSAVGGLGDYITVGKDRAEAERYYTEGIASGKWPRPKYRVIAVRKVPVPSFADLVS